MTERPQRERLARTDAEAIYVRAGELEVFRQLERDAVALDAMLAEGRAFALGPFARLRADVVVDELGKTRGAINNLWGSQEAFRAAVMARLLNDIGLGVDEVELPDPASCADLDDWIDRIAAVEIQRGPRHGQTPENCYGLRWSAWLGMVAYGIWSDAVATASLEEFRLGVAHYAGAVLRPALERFELELAGVTLDDLALAVSSTVEGFWLNACLTLDDPIGEPRTMAGALATALRLLLRGATRRSDEID